MRGETVPCRFCGGVDGDGHLFFGLFFSPLVHLVKNLEFSSLITVSKKFVAKVYYLAWLVTWSFKAKWESVGKQRGPRMCLDDAPGSYPPDFCRTWVVDDLDEVAECMPDNHFVWFDGSCVTDDPAEVSVAGAGVFSEESGIALNARFWCILMIFSSVMRSGMAVLALPACSPVFLRGAQSRHLIKNINCSNTSLTSCGSGVDARSGSARSKGMAS